MATVKKKKAKPPVKLPLYTRRMLQVIEFIKENNIKGCKTDADVLLLLGFSEGSVNNLPNIERGHQKFTVLNYDKMINVFGVDANFLFVEKHIEMFPTTKPRTQKQLIREALSTM